MVRCPACGHDLEEEMEKVLVEVRSKILVKLEELREKGVEPELEELTAHIKCPACEVVSDFPVPLFPKITTKIPVRGKPKYPLKTNYRIERNDQERRFRVKLTMTGIPTVPKVSAYVPAWQIKQICQLIRETELLGFKDLLQK